jgi:2-polyprenyl-3-methyl-5-hydroxy-6-metoxy-1,4-benzoquinol methylase
MWAVYGVVVKEAESPMSQVRSSYDRYWSSDSTAPPEVDPTTGRRVALLRAAISRLPTGAAVLDAGSGAGIFTSVLCGLGYAVTAVDVSPAALSAARERAPTARFVEAELGLALPLADHEFDAVFCTEVIEHIMDTGTLAAEFGRVLKPGGLLLLTTPYHGLIKNILIALFAFDKHYAPTGPHIRYFSVRSLSSLLGAHGFSVRRTRGIGRAWPVWKSLWVEAVKER